MESSACRRRASDAEKSAWAYSVNAECKPVKEEPEWGECGVSAAAAAEGLFADHKVKDEVVIGPEIVQQQDVVFSIQNALNRIKEDKLEGDANAAPDCTHTYHRNGPRCNRSTEQQYGLTSCFVRLERLPVGHLHRSKPCNIMQANPSASALWRRAEQGRRSSCNLPTPLACHQQSALNKTDEDPCKLKPAGGAGAVPEWTHTRSGEGPCSNIRHKQQLKLRSCSLRPERILMEDLPTCNTCLFTFDSKSSLRSHNCTHSVEDLNFYKEACDETAKTYFKCDNSGKQYLQKTHLVKDLAMHHVNTGSEILLQLQYSTDDDAARIDNTVEASYSDNAATSKTRNQPVLAPHTVEKSSLLRCDICSNIFAQKQDLIKHVAIIHKQSDSKKPKLYKCDICNKCFSTRKSLTAHNRSHTGEKPFSCDVCKSEFSHRNHLTVHRRTHTGEKPYSCDVCKLQFTQRSNLTVHKRTHTGERPFSCDVCKSKFTLKTHMVTHRRTHTGEKPFSCDVCKSEFTQRYHLTVHKRIHTGEKPFSCNVCKLRFTNRSSLAVHRRTHTGAKPYSCDVCKLQFTQRSNLTVHKRTHTGERPFSCDVCKSEFTQKSHMARHRRTHTGEEPFSCD